MRKLFACCHGLVGSPVASRADAATPLPADSTSASAATAKARSGGVCAAGCQAVKHSSTKSVVVSPAAKRGCASTSRRKGMLVTTSPRMT